jgi:hypothetical protein
MNGEAARLATPTADQDLWRAATPRLHPALDAAGVPDTAQGYPRPPQDDLVHEGSRTPEGRLSAKMTALITAALCSRGPRASAA